MKLDRWDTGGSSLDCSLNKMLESPDYGREYKSLMRELCSVAMAYLQAKHLRAKSWRGKYTAGSRAIVRTTAEALDNLVSELAKLRSASPELLDQIMPKEVQNALADVPIEPKTRRKTINASANRAAVKSIKRDKDDDQYY